MDAAYQHLVPTQGASFAFSVVDLERFPFHWHFHPEYELTLIRSGRGLRHVGDHIGAFGPGDLVLVGPELPHSWRSISQPGDPGEERSTAVVVQFHGDFLGETFLERRELRAVCELLEAAAASGLAFPAASARTTRRLLTAMARQDGLARLLGLLRALADLARAAPAATALASDGYHPRDDEGARRRIAAVCGYVQQHHGTPIRLGDAAAVAHMTPSALSRAFHRATGRTFTTYVNEVRVGAACRMLVETDLSIGTIAAESGFANLANFNRRFRELRATTPRRYRAAFARPDGSP